MQQQLQADLDQARTKPVQADQGIQTGGEWYQEREREMNGIKAQLDEKKKHVDELEDSTRKQTIAATESKAGRNGETTCATSGGFDERGAKFERTSKRT
jgi:hypothetical protein